LNRFLKRTLSSKGYNFLYITAFSSLPKEGKVKKQGNQITYYAFRKVSSIEVELSTPIFLNTALLLSDM